MVKADKSRFLGNKLTEYYLSSSAKTIWRLWLNRYFQADQKMVMKRRTVNRGTAEKGSAFESFKTLRIAAMKCAC